MTFQINYVALLQWNFNKSTVQVNIKIVPKSSTLIICEKFSICYNIMMGSRKPSMDIPYNFTVSFAILKSTPLMLSIQPTDPTS